jgi:plastocyanin
MNTLGRARRIAPMIAVLVVAACAGDPGVRPDNNGGGNNTPTLAATVTVANNSFSPGTVTILRTGTVTWNWTGGPHNVTFSNATSNNRSAGETFARTFDTAGTFTYQCTLHPPTMQGTVIVQ